MTEWNAAGYARISMLQATMAEEVLALLNLRGDEHILDVGCGNGKTTTEIAVRVPQGKVVGVDASAAMVAFATSNNQHANLEFTVADARHLPFTQEFDLVVSFNALHWIPEQALALQSIHSSLKPGGRAQLRLVPKGERKSLENVIEETRLSPQWSDYFNSFHDPYLHLTPEEYAGLAEQQGFRVLSKHTAAKAWDFQSRAAFEAFGSVTFIEWTQHLPEPQRPNFVKDVLDRYRPVACDSAGEEYFFRFYQMDIMLSAK
ncbi:class I SAM-dependent methyltransferase [Alloacidobacterium dinghuense]|uniref:Class I SAM-dependent methyltransferase n=1 Tax=Alloacidobacterium dinghuense TaxID=2763107 RepID=A0A7G8BHA9_9BACT|nr:class I SAM-dependent methyltransferase [Alloacidobacterium dinghuense]QNI31929.1 class I SAM-dependent methyltransferase [Alloacidobacterium dinghuense]